MTPERGASQDPQEGESSRSSGWAAGWGRDRRDDAAKRHWIDRLHKRIDPKWDSFSWLTVRALMESVNDVVAKAGPTIVHDRRERWVAQQRAAGVESPGARFKPDLIIDRTPAKQKWWKKEERKNPRFILIGDTGEADPSQYAMVDPILAVHKGKHPACSSDRESDFMVIVSDVIYPAGDVNEYVNAFYLPYEEYDRPIYAIPGNHDWYDGLNGFMFHFCAAEPLPPGEYSRWSYTPGERAALKSWRGAARPDREALAPWMADRRRREAGKPILDEDQRPKPAPPRRPVQPASYFAIDLGELLVVSIDTGIDGKLDAAQGDWLRKVSEGSEEKPKILLTGKPIYVNNEYHPCEIVWGEDAPKELPPTADDIVRKRKNNYVAAIGGDIHNYQRYPVRLDDGRTIQYITSGGGGAYLTATHSIPSVGTTVDQKLPPDVRGFMETDEDGVEQEGEKAFRCYPLRGDSLALFARQVGPVLFNALVGAAVLIVAAYVVLFHILDLTAEREEAIVVTSFLAAALVIALVGGVVMRDVVIKLLPEGYRAAMLAAAIAALGLVIATVLIWIGRWEVSSAAGITLGLPFLLLGGVVIAYTVRGSAPVYMPDLLFVAPLVAAYVVLGPFELDVYEPLGFLVYVVGPLVVGGGALAFLRGARGRSPDQFWQALKILVTVAWVSLLVVIFVFEEGVAPSDDPFSSKNWVLWLVVALFATTLVVTRFVPKLAGGQRRPHQTDQKKQLGETATAIIALTFIGLILLALGAIDDGWPGQVTAGAFSAVMGALSVYLLLAATVALRIGPVTLRQLQSGYMDPDFAAGFVSEQIGGGDPVRPPGRLRPDDSKRRMAKAVWKLGKGVSELVDTNDPPFYGSFLSVEVNGDSKRGHELVIRNHGVTGWSKIPTLEDCVVISL